MNLRQDFQTVCLKLPISELLREGLTVRIDIFLQDKNKVCLVILCWSGSPYFVIQIRPCFTFVIRNWIDLLNQAKLHLSVIAE